MQEYTRLEIAIYFNIIEVKWLETLDIRFLKRFDINCGSSLKFLETRGLKCVDCKIP